MSQSSSIQSSNNQPSSIRQTSSNAKIGIDGLYRYDGFISDLRLSSLLESKEKSSPTKSETQTAPTTQENKEMRLLCDVLTHLEQAGRFVEIINKCKYPKEIKDWWKNHKKDDEKRWFTHYHSIFPNFSSDEIAKMVRNGILKDI